MFANYLTMVRGDNWQVRSCFRGVHDSRTLANPLIVFAFRLSLSMADDPDESTPPRKRLREDRSFEFDLCPRTINVTEFVEARALEITQLLAVVDNASLPAGEVAQGPRTFVQRLPRHMRRRAMSYNIKRLPRRVRPMAESTIKVRRIFIS